MTAARFAGGDQAYLRDEQYRDPSRLTARANLHERYGTATEPWPAWVAARIDLQAGADVLDVGCGPGFLWAQTGCTGPAWRHADAVRPVARDGRGGARSSPRDR